MDVFHKTLCLNGTDVDLKQILMSMADSLETNEVSRDFVYQKLITAGRLELFSWFLTAHPPQKCDTINIVYRCLSEGSTDAVRIAMDHGIPKTAFQSKFALEEAIGTGNLDLVTFLLEDLPVEEKKVLRSGLSRFASEFGQNDIASYLHAC